MDQFDLQDAFRKNVKAKRIALGMTQTDLAAKIGCTQPFVAQVESGRESPTLKTVQRFVEALDLPRSEIFNDLREKPETAA